MYEYFPHFINVDPEILLRDYFPQTPLPSE